MGMASIPLRAAPVLRIAAPRTFPSFAGPRVWLVAALLLALVVAPCFNLPWLIGFCELVLFAAAGTLAMLKRSTRLSQPRLPLLLATAIPLWGVAGMLLGHAAYNYAALVAVLYWTSLPASFLLGLLLLKGHAQRDAFLASLWLLAAAVTCLELYQILVLGRYAVLPSGYPLLSSNFYAELAELLLPAVLVTALRKGSRLWLGAMLSAFMVATAVAAGARMGTALLLLEAASVIIVTRKAAGYRTLTWRRHGLALAGLLLAALALEGTTYLTTRFRQDSLLAGRSEIARSAFTMASQHPAIGFGMGAFPVVYPAYALLDTTSFVNHVHDDYLEIAVEGGLPALLLWCVFVAVCAPAVVKAPWAFGTFAILVHSTSDFPLYRLAVLILMALLCAAAGTRKAASDAGPAITQRRPYAVVAINRRAA